MDSAVMDLLKDLQEEMTKVQNVRENNRGSPLKDHLAMVADGVDALGWITIDPKPAEYVVELFGGAQMFGNKVLKEFKDRCEIHDGCIHSFSIAHTRIGMKRKSNGSNHSTNSCGPLSPTSKNITSRDYNGMRREWMLPKFSIKSSPPRMARQQALDP